MKANIFCNVCKKPLRAVKEWGRNEVDVYVIPCNCAAQHRVQADGATPCDNCGTIGAHDCSEPDNHPAIPPRR